MKKDLISLSIIIAAAAVMFASCSKSSSKTVSERLVGKWSLQKTANDGNANGKADASEWKGLSYDTLGFTITYSIDLDVKAGGAGMAYLAIPLASLNDSALFSWATANSDKNIAVTTSDMNLGPFINGSFAIDSLTDHVMILEKDSLGTKVWMYMTK